MAAETRSTAVATIAPPRLPYPMGAEERFNVDRSMWKALVEAVFPLAKTPDAVVLALAYCKARKLDPFKRVVHIVPIWDNDKRAYVETVWPGISEHRITAMRTGQHGGLDVPSFGPTLTETFKGQDRKGNAVQANVTFPEWCQITVYRLVGGVRCPFPGPKIYWREFFSQQGRTGVPNDRWQKAPSQMLEKCAEAAALRRAFPEELGDEHTAEEVEARGTMKDITPPAADVPEPTREQFQEPARTTTDATDHVDEPLPSDDAPSGWELFDHTGEQIGEYGIAEWIGAYDASQPKVAMKKERALHFQNNADSARAIYMSSDCPDAVRKALDERFSGLAKKEADLLAGAK